MLNLDLNKITDLYLREVFKQIIAQIPTATTGPRGPKGDKGDAGEVSGRSLSSAKLTVTRTALVPILAGDCVYSTSSGVLLAQPDNTLEKSTVLGIAMTDAISGADVEILRMGIISLSTFSVFTSNKQLFLDVDGGITDTRRTTGFLSLVAKSLGNNEIFVSINDPITLGA